MAKEKSRRSPADHLPKKAPKKTGSRGVGPKEEPAGKDAAGDKETQAELLEVQQAPVPVVVENRFAVQYKKPIFSIASKSGTKLLSLQMVVMLTDEHKKRGILPGIVRAGWDFVTKPKRKQVTLIDVPGVAAKIFLASDSPESDPALFLPAAKIIGASLAVIQKKGEGESLKVIRFMFRLQVEAARDVAKWAEANYGSTLWMNLSPAQGEMFDDEKEGE
jgi:hypothetical protein